MCGCLSHTCHCGPGPQPRHVPRLGIKLATFRFTGWCSIHWTTPARALWIFLHALDNLIFSVAEVNNCFYHYAHSFYNRVNTHPTTCRRCENQDFNPGSSASKPLPLTPSLHSPAVRLQVAAEHLPCGQSEVRCAGRVKYKLDFKDVVRKNKE